MDYLLYYYRGRLYNIYQLYYYFIPYFSYWWKFHKYWITYVRIIYCSPILSYFYLFYFLMSINREIALSFFNNFNTQIGIIRFRNIYVGNNANKYINKYELCKSYWYTQCDKYVGERDTFAGWYCWCCSPFCFICTGIAYVGILPVFW